MVASYQTSRAAAAFLSSSFLVDAYYAEAAYQATTFPAASYLVDPEAFRVEAFLGASCRVEAYP